MNVAIIGWIAVCHFLRKAETFPFYFVNYQKFSTLFCSGIMSVILSVSFRTVWYSIVLYYINAYCTVHYRFIKVLYKDWIVVRMSCITLYQNLATVHVCFIKGLFVMIDMIFTILVYCWCFEILTRGGTQWICFVFAVDFVIVITIMIVTEQSDLMFCTVPYYVIYKHIQHSYQLTYLLIYLPKIILQYNLSDLQSFIH